QVRPRQQLGRAQRQQTFLARADADEGDKAGGPGLLGRGCGIHWLSSPSLVCTAGPVTYLPAPRRSNSRATSRPMRAAAPTGAAPPALSGGGPAPRVTAAVPRHA